MTKAKAQKTKATKAKAQKAKAQKALSAKLADMEAKNADLEAKLEKAKAEAKVPVSKIQKMSAIVLARWPGIAAEIVELRPAMAYLKKHDVVLPLYVETENVTVLDYHNAVKSTAGYCYHIAEDVKAQAENKSAKGKKKATAEEDDAEADDILADLDAS